MDLADSLKRFRTERHLTFAAAAAAFGKARTAWYSYEKGIAIPPITAIISVAKEFGVSTDYLLGLTDDPTPRWKVDTAPAAENDAPSEGASEASPPAAPSEMTPAELTAAIKKIEARLDAMENLKG